LRLFRPGPPETVPLPIPVLKPFSSLASSQDNETLSQSPGMTMPRADSMQDDFPELSNDLYGNKAENKEEWDEFSTEMSITSKYILYCRL
jgi:hypothetical protein